MVNVCVLFVAVIAVVSARVLPAAVPAAAGVEAPNDPARVHLPGDRDGTTGAVGSTGTGTPGWDACGTASANSPSTALAFITPPLPLGTKTLTKRKIPTKTVNAIFWSFVGPFLLLYVLGMASPPGSRLRRWLHGLRGRRCVCGFRMSVGARSWKDGEWRTRFREERDAGVNGWGVEEVGVEVPPKAFLGWKGR